MAKRAGGWMTVLVLATVFAGCDNGTTTPDAADDAGTEADVAEVAPDVPDVAPDVPEVEPDVLDVPVDVPEVVPDVADVPVDVADVPEDVLPDGETSYEGILCGFGICEPSGEVCCATGIPTSSEECTAPGACAGDFVLTCDGAEDCAEGERCCMPSGAVMQTTCASACASGLFMCHVLADCDDGDPSSFDYCFPSMCLYPMFERGLICVHSFNEDCTNAVDDDGDTMIDVDDPDCSHFPC